MISWDLPNGLYVVLGGLVTALAAYGAARFTSGTQLKITRENSYKDLTLQAERLADERLIKEVDLERQNLKNLHCILSLISLENSQTMSYFQSSDVEISTFRERYIQNCHRLHEAMAITDLYYPALSSAVNDIYGQTSIFWGYQEDLMRMNIKENSEGWHSALSRILEAGNKIEILKNNLHQAISKQGKFLSNKMQSGCGK